jgi:hypothetical protein
MVGGGGKLWKASFGGGCRAVPVRMVRDKTARLRLTETWIWPEIRWTDGGGFVWSRRWWELCDGDGENRIKLEPWLLA